MNKKLKSGGEMLLCECHAHIVKESTCTLTKQGYVSMYSRSDQKTYLVHRLIVGAKPRSVVDHINRNKLDNRCSNLRVCNHSQNLANTLIQKNNTSGFKGVTWDKQASLWKAQIAFKGKQTSLGHYKEAAAAARAYDEAAKEVYGAFAVLNVDINAYA